METKKKISLLSAILININIILGAGLFINPKPLTQMAGPLGFLSYGLAALVLLPIVLSIANLAQMYPTAGGLYIYSKKYIGSLTGFLSGWSYFLGKTTSAALLTHTFVSFFQRRIIFLQNFSVLFLDCLVILSLILINSAGVSIGGKIQYFFTASKMIPVLFVLFFGVSLFSPDFFTFNFAEMKGLLSALPIAIFALTSFEIICSIGHLVDKPEKNLRKAILYSFFIVAGIAMLFQFMIFGSLGSLLKSTSEPILAFGSQLFKNNIFLAKLINAFVFASVIGGAFGSLTSNCWNFYALSKDKHIPFGSFFTKVNSNNVPWISLLTEGFVACLLLAVSKNQIALQNMTVFGIVTAYMCSCIAAFIVTKAAKNRNGLIISTLAIFSSFYIVFLCLKNIFISGISFSYAAIFFTGITLAIIQRFKKG